VTVEEVHAALRQHIHPESLRIVAVGGTPGSLQSELVDGVGSTITYQGVLPDEAQRRVDAEVGAKSLGISTFSVVSATELFR
jgi:hypothetical protein